MPPPTGNGIIRHVPHRQLCRSPRIQATFRRRSPRHKPHRICDPCQMANGTHHRRSRWGFIGYLHLWTGHQSIRIQEGDDIGIDFDECHDLCLVFCGLVAGLLDRTAAGRDSLGFLVSSFANDLRNKASETVDIMSLFMPNIYPTLASPTHPHMPVKWYLYNFEGQSQPLCKCFGRSVVSSSLAPHTASMDELIRQPGKSPSPCNGSSLVRCSCSSGSCQVSVRKWG